MSDYEEMTKEFEETLASIKRNYGIENEALYSEDCDACNGSKDYYADSEGNVVIAACYGCNDIQDVG